jgi:hypothetical protein
MRPFAHRQPGLDALDKHREPEAPDKSAGSLPTDWICHRHRTWRTIMPHWLKVGSNLLSTAAVASSNLSKGLRRGSAAEPTLQAMRRAAARIVAGAKVVLRPGIGRV